MLRDTKFIAEGLCTRMVDVSCFCPFVLGVDRITVMLIDFWILVRGVQHFLLLVFLAGIRR